MCINRLCFSDLPYLNDKQNGFLRANEIAHCSNVTSSNRQMVKNGEDLICIEVRYPALIDYIIEQSEPQSISGDISITVVTPKSCDKDTFTTTSKHPQTYVNRVCYNSNCVYLSINTDQDTIDMITSILGARWSYLYDKNLKKVTDLMAAYTEINSPKVISVIPSVKKQVKGLINKQGAELLAFYLCMDFSDISDYEYHRGHWTQKVYCIGDVYYCPHKSRPSYRYEDGIFERKNWVKVSDIPFPYSNNIIWRYEHDVLLSE